MKAFRSSMLHDPVHSFEIIGDQIFVKASAARDYEAMPAIELVVQVADWAGASYDEAIRFDPINQGFTGQVTQDDLTALGSSEDDVLTGGQGQGQDTLLSGAGSDVLSGGDGGHGSGVRGGNGSGGGRAYGAGGKVGDGSGGGSGAGREPPVAGGFDDYLDGGAGDDLLRGGAGDDLLAGRAGDDAALFGAGEGADHFTGGRGWTDSIALDDSSGAVSVEGRVITGDGWIATIDGEGAIEAEGADHVLLSEDAAGTITFDDGATMSFDEVERMSW